MGNFNEKVFNAYKNLENINEIINQDKKTNTITICGNTSVGKSSFLNKLLNKDLSTIGNTTTTTLPIIFQFDNTNRIKIYLISYNENSLEIMINNLKEEYNKNFEKINTNNNNFYFLKLLDVITNEHSYEKCKTIISIINEKNLKISNKIKSNTSIEIVVIIGDNTIKFSKLLKFVDLPGDTANNKYITPYLEKYYNISDEIYVITTPKYDDINNLYLTLKDVYKYSNFRGPTKIIVNKMDLNEENIIDNILDNINCSLEDSLTETLQEEINIIISKLMDINYKYHYHPVLSSIFDETKFLYVKSDIIETIKKFQNIKNKNINEKKKIINTINLVIIMFNVKFEKENDLNIKNLKYLNIDWKYFDNIKNIYLISVKENFNIEKIYSELEIFNKNCDINYINNLSDLLINIYDSYFSTKNHFSINNTEVYLSQDILNNINEKTKDIITDASLKSLGYGVTTGVFMSIITLGIGIPFGAIYGTIVGITTFLTNMINLKNFKKIDIYKNGLKLSTQLTQTGNYFDKLIEILNKNNNKKDWIKYKLNNGIVELIDEKFNKEYKSKIKFTDNIKYKGYFKCLKYNGEGTIYINKKPFIQGTFKDGKMNDVIIYINEKKIFEGKIEDNKLLGKYYIYNIFTEETYMTIIN